jgi:hypothetical protein
MHSSVRIAKLIGFVLIVVGVIVMIFGVIARPFVSCYDAKDILISEGEWKSLGLGPGWKCPDWSEGPYDEPHALCGQSVPDWALIELAALPILAEAQKVDDPNRVLYHYFACLTNVSLMQSDPEINFSTKSILSFNRKEGKLAVGLPSIPFDANISIYLENFFSSYYPDILGIFVPFYSIAYKNLLSRMLATTSQALISGILGPNRLSTSYLDQATITARMELNAAYDIFEALRLSPHRPVVVGHGANGLLAKALPFSSDPWRVSFEGPVLEDSPIATLAQDPKVESQPPTIINFYTNGSIYALADDAAIGNNRIPRSHLSAAVPPGPFETFCIVAAACAEDKRYDILCNDVFRQGKFLELWKKLRRDRVT